MSDWKETTWGNITTLEYGKPVNYKQLDGTVPVYGTNGQIGFTNSEPLCKFPSVIVGRKGAYRGVHFSPVPFCVIDTGFFLKPICKDIIDLKFAYYNLLNTDINRLDSGSAIPSTSRPDFYQLDLLLPQPPEQKRIANILSCLDAKIENLRRQNETLEQIAQTLFKHWFIDFEFPNADGKPYKSSGGAMSPSELGDIPEGWRVGKLESEIEIQKGVSYKGEGLAISATGIPMHNLKSVYEGGGYRHDGIKFYNGEYKERHICKSGDILVPNTEQGEKHKLIGFPAIIPRYFKDTSIFTHHLFRVVPLKTSYLSRQYIYYLIASYVIRKQMLGYTNGTTVNMLSPDGLKKPLLVKPDANIIKSFTEIITPVWEKQENNFDQIQTLTKTRDALLPKLMSGQLRVKE
jgi:type I restriction enzyme S subunit